MGIADLPDCLDDMVRLNAAFETENFRFAETNRRIAESTRDLLLGFYLPRRLVPYGRSAENSARWLYTAITRAERGLVILQ